MLIRQGKTVGSKIGIMSRLHLVDSSVRLEHALYDEQVSRRHEKSVYDRFYEVLSGSFAYVGKEYFRNCFSYCLITPVPQIGVCQFGVRVHVHPGALDCSPTIARATLIDVKDSFCGHNVTSPPGRIGALIGPTGLHSGPGGWGGL